MFQKLCYYIQVFTFWFFIKQHIFYIEKDYTADEFTSYNFNEEPPAFPDSYYESVWDTGTGVSALADDETTGEELTDRIELEDELKDSVDSQQEN